MQNKVEQRERNALFKYDSKRYDLLSPSYALQQRGEHALATDRAELEEQELLAERIRGVVRETSRMVERPQETQQLSQEG